MKDKRSNQLRQIADDETGILSSELSDLNVVKMSRYAADAGNVM